MTELPPKHPRPDTTGWPVVEARPDDVWLGSFDQAGMRIDSPTCGAAEFSHAVMLPEVVFDASNPADADPAILAARRAGFVLTVTPPPGTARDQLAGLVNSLFTAMREYEVELGGAGLFFEVVDAPEGSVAFRVAAMRLEGAPERLHKLRSAITNDLPPTGLGSAVRSLRERDFTVAV